MAEDVDVDGVSAGDGDGWVDSGLDDGAESFIGEGVKVDARDVGTAGAGIGAIGTGLKVWEGPREGERWDWRSKFGIDGSARSCAGMEGEETSDDMPLRGSPRVRSASRGVSSVEEVWTIMLAGRSGEEGICLATG